MKDYYYFLGITEEASDEDIKKAYRKLSLKYHPDKNDNDAFFANRFREIQEAYEILSDTDKRRTYNTNFVAHQRTFRSSLPPTIKSFSANKLKAKKGEEIIIKWNTINADVVKVLPFGLEKSYGERIFKITEFKDGKFVLLLHAQNTLLQKTVVQGITISEGFEEEKNNIPNWGEKMDENTNKSSNSNEKFLRILKITIAVILLVLVLYFFKKN